ncbi:hypothetical protein F5Y10DRAFT_289454 [Nemania abortiva]|nr:hypothetical protein F5Y10DRAFT_289454 [Nemania abortiva]
MATETLTETMTIIGPFIELQNQKLEAIDTTETAVSTVTTNMSTKAVAVPRRGISECVSPSEPAAVVSPSNTINSKATPRHLNAGDELRHHLAKLGLETPEGFQWADDPDLSTISITENKPRRDIGQQRHEGFKGLDNSRWANHKDLVPIRATGDTSKQTVIQQRPQESSKTFQRSPRRLKDQPSVDREMLENKLKRELIQYGLKGQHSANNNSLSKKPATRPDIQSPTEPLAKPPPTRPPNRPPTRPRPASRPSTKITESSNNRRLWNNKKDSRNYRESSGQTNAENEASRETPRVHMDMAEFQREVKKYGLKTLRDSRWADEEKEEVPKEAPSVLKNMPKVQQEPEKHSPGIPTDHHRADKGEAKKEKGVPEEIPRIRDVDESQWEPNEYGVPGLQVDKAEFEQDVKQYGLKTLKDSRWAE